MIYITGSLLKEDLLTTDYKVIMNKHTDSVLLHYARNVIMKKLFYIKHLGPDYNYHNKKFEEFVEDVVTYYKSQSGKVHKRFYNDCKRCFLDLSEEETTALYYWMFATDKWQHKIADKVKEMFGVDKDSEEFIKFKGRFIAYKLHDPEKTNLELDLAIMLHDLCSVDYKDDEEAFLENPHLLLQKHYFGFIEGLDFYYNIDLGITDELDDINEMEFNAGGEINEELLESKDYKSFKESSKRFEDTTFLYDDDFVDNIVLSWIKMC